MVKQTKTICQHCFSVSVFDHFVGLALNGLKKYAFIRSVKQKKVKQLIDSHRRIQDPIKHLRCSVFVKVVNGG